MQLLALFLLIPFLMCGQGEGDKEESLFIALYTVGEKWDVEKSPNEQAYFKDHSAFLKKLRDEGSITMGARYSDTGMIILKAADLESAKKLLTSDLAIQNNLFSVEIHPFAPFYKGCIE